MSKSFFCTAVLAGLGMAAVASAAVTVTVQNVGAPVYATGTTATGYTGYVISLVSTNGVNIASYDFSSQPGFGVNGPLVQKLTASEGDGVYNTPAVNPGGTAVNSAATTNNLDSHFYYVSGSGNNQTYLGFASSESYGTNPTAPTSGTKTVASFPQNSDSTGYEISGTNGNIQAFTGFASSIQSTTQILGYIVVANSATSAVTGTGAVSTADSALYPVSFSISATPAPEPATVGLLAAGLSSFALRRRRA